MDPDHNPYTPGAGSIPLEVAGRQEEFEDFRRLISRMRLGRHERSIIIYGPRGVGKTVFLNECEDIALEAGFEARYKELTPETELLDVVIRATHRFVRTMSLTKKAKASLASALGYLTSFKVTASGDIEFSLGEKPEEDILSEDLSELFVEVGRLAIDHGRGLVLLLDEMQFADPVQLRALLSGLHRVSQKNLPIAVAAAGLPQVPGVVAEARTYSERLFKFRPIGPLPDYSAAEALTAPAAGQGVTYTKPALEAALAWARGFPFFLQQIGSDAWNVAQGPSEITQADIAKAEPIALKHLDDGFFKARIQRATETEEQYLLAMASLGEGPYRSRDVASAMGGRTVQAASPHRESLIAKGLIYPTGVRGYVDFTVPLFHEYLSRQAN